MDDLTGRCSCGAACESRQGEPVEVCPGCGRAPGPLAPSAEADLVQTRGRLLPRGLWVAESLLAAAAWLAVALGYACTLLLLAWMVQCGRHYGKEGDGELFMFALFWGSLGVPLLVCGILLRKRSPSIRTECERIGGLLRAIVRRSTDPERGESALGVALTPIRAGGLSFVRWMACALRPCYDGVPLAPLWSWPAGTPLSHLRTLAQGLMVLVVFFLLIPAGLVAVVIAVMRM